MSSVIEVEVDLADYEDEIRDYLNGGIKENCSNLVLVFLTKFCNAAFNSVCCMLNFILFSF